MNDMKIFNSNEFGDIRTDIHNGEPMFCLSDVCKALGLTQPSKVKERLNEKGVRTIPSLNVWISKETNAQTISEMYYGMEIPEEHQSEVLKNYIRIKAKDL